MINSADLLSQFAAANKSCVRVVLMLHEISSAYWRAHIACQQICTGMENSTKLFAEITFDETKTNRKNHTQKIIKQIDRALNKESRRKIN